MQRYITLFQNFPIVKRLTVIQLITYFGAWFSNVAIYTLLITLDVSASAIALVAALHFLPGVLQAPFSGVIIDRVKPKKIMVLLLAVQIFSTLALTLVTDAEMLWLLYLMVVLRMAAASFYFTVEMSLLPKLLDHESLNNANTMHSMIWSISYTAGMALSGFFVALVGVKTAFFVDAGFFIVALGILLLTQIRVDQKREQTHFFDDLIEGYRYIKKTPKIMALIMMHSVIGLTAFDALVALLAKHHYASVLAVPLAIGWMHAIRAFALVLGPMFLAPFMSHQVLYYLLWFEGIMIIIWAVFIENFMASLVMSFAVGLAITSLWSYTYTLLQTQTDEAFYGRVISYNDMIFLLVSGMTALFIGFAYEWGMSFFAIAFTIGVMFILSAFYFKWIKRRFLDV